MLIIFVLANCRLQSHASLSQLIAEHPLLQEPHCHWNLWSFSHPHLGMSPRLAFSPSSLDALHQLLDILGLDGLATYHAHEHYY